MRDRCARLLVAFTLCATLCFLALAGWEVRFWQNSSGPQLCLTLVTVGLLAQTRSVRFGHILIIATAAGLFLPAALGRVMDVHAALRARSANRLDLVPPLQRDLARAIRQSQPAGEVVLLACPTTSTGIGYFGRFKTIGTLFWENFAGLRTAAEIFSTPNEAEAHAKILAHGITHIVLTSEEDFLRNYFSLLHPDASPAEFERTFGYALFHKRQLPLWLRPLPYAPPSDLRHPELRVLALQVVPDQTQSEALYHIAHTQLLLGEREGAERSLVAGLERLNPNERANYALQAGNLCYQQNFRAAAGRLYRIGLTSGGNATLAMNLAWLLSTDPEPAVRHGSDALILAQRCVDARPDDFNCHNTLAASLAENGRFSEAITSARRALEIARTSSDPATVTMLDRRLKSYESGQPWRQ
jgi:tetratricopeptide (TPR) repeat protein